MFKGLSKKVIASIIMNEQGSIPAFIKNKYSKRKSEKCGLAFSIKLFSLVAFEEPLLFSLSP